MAFGLNTCHGRAGADKPLAFDNIELLLSYLVTLPKSLVTAALHGFEFGNEVCVTGVTMEQWTKDLEHLHSLVRQKFLAAGYSESETPVLIGPDCGFRKDFIQPVFSSGHVLIAMMCG